MCAQPLIKPPSTPSLSPHLFVRLTRKAALFNTVTAPVISSSSQCVLASPSFAGAHLSLAKSYSASVDRLAGMFGRREVPERVSACSSLVKGPSGLVGTCSLFKARFVFVAYVYKLSSSLSLSLSLSFFLRAAVLCSIPSFQSVFPESSRLLHPSTARQHRQHCSTITCLIIIST